MAEMTSMGTGDILRNLGGIFINSLKYLHNDHVHSRSMPTVALLT